MRVPHYNVGIKGDECQCGRRASVVHCPVCGSTRRYARSNRMHKMLDGNEKFVKTEFRCMTCNHEYIDEERALCEAPPIGAVLAQQRVKSLHDASQTGEYLNPVEKKAADSILKALRSGQSLDEAEPNLAQDGLTEKELLKLEWDLRRLWADANIAFKMKRSNVDPGRWQSYVKEKMKELGIDWTERPEEPERITNEEAEQAQ